MITVHISKNQMHFLCNTAEDSAALAIWMDQEDPKILFNEFYGSSTPEPCEFKESEGGLHLNKVGYITRRIGGTVWNSKVLK